MMCNRCEKTSSISNIFNHKSSSCFNCSEILKNIEKFQNIGKSLYTQRILNILHATKVLNIKDFENETFSFENILYDITNVLGIQDSMYTDVHSKKRVLYQIIGVASSDLIEKIKLFPEVLFFCFMSSFEYNRFVANARIANLRSKTSPIITQDDFVNLICDAERMLKYNVNLELDLAKDRWILDILINCIVSVKAKMNLELSVLEKNVNIKDISNVFTTLSLIFELNEMSISDELELYPLEIRKDGTIYLKSEEDFTGDYEKFIISDRSPIVNDERSYLTEEIVNDVELNKCIKEYFGCSITEMLQLHSSIKNISNLDEIMIGSYALWCEFISHYGNVSIEDASKFLNCLIKVGDIHFNEALVANTNNSLVRKPLVKIDDMYICIHSIFDLAILNTVQDLIIGDVKNYKQISNKLTAYYNKKNEQFEIEVKTYLEMKYKNSIIVHNVCEGFFVLDGNSVFPGQMDLLILYNNYIYLVECKNYNLKITPKSEQNLLGTLEKKVYRNMEKKISFIKNQKEFILRKYNQNPNEYSDDIKGIIAISNFVGIKQIGNFKVVNYKDILL